MAAAKQGPNYRVVCNPLAKGGIELRGDVRRAFSSREPRFILSGPADTGKTFALCLKVHLAALRYPGSQHAIMRKTNASIPGSVLLTFNRLIRGAPVRVLGGEYPMKYVYSNGSAVWIGGLDRPERVLSSERDSIYVVQAEELSQNDWEMLSTRCTGRSRVMPYTQLFGDCNPAGSTHWILRLANEGKLKLYRAVHRDNPSLYDAAGNLMPGAAERLSALAALTGVRRKRLFEGEWVSVEGAVYEEFQRSVHVQSRPLSEFRRFYIAVDEGFVNPAAILLVGLDEDGRWHVLQEIYRSGMLQSSIVESVRGLYNTHRCELVAVDAAAASLIASLNAAGCYTVGAKGRVLDGIARVRNLLAVQGDGKPRLTVEPDCVNCINEFESYVWASNAARELPVKEHDHALDALRYLAEALAVSGGGFTGSDIAALCRGVPFGEAEDEAVTAAGADVDFESF